MTEEGGIRNVIIIGSGPSGYTAGLYTARASLNPLMFAGYADGGQLMLTSEVENFPGYPSGSKGPDMMKDMKKQAESFGLEIIKKDVTKVDFSQRPYKIIVGKKTYLTHAVIISTGAEAIWLGLKGEQNLQGRGVSTCATCDGSFFKDEDVCVIGGGDSACEEALYLSRICKSVTLIHRRDVFKASTIMYERVEKNPKITIKPFRQVKAWVTDKQNLKAVSLEDPRDPKVKETLEVSGAFIAIGHKPITAFLNNQVELKDGYILHKEHTMTSKPGVFAAGDVVDTRYKQAITAAGMGCMAAIDAERWLDENVE